MKHALAPIVLALFALPARGDEAGISDDATDALTTIDALPSTGSLDRVFGDEPLSHLVDIADGTTPTNLGVQLRAIRALPAFCPQALDGASLLPCNTGDPHDALQALVRAFAEPPAPPADNIDAPTGDPDPAAAQILRLRAAIEALGATHSHADADVQLLLELGLLDHASRDIRAAAAWAMLAIPVGCDDAEALAKLEWHAKGNEDSLQVRAVCNSVVDALDCP